MVSVTLCSFRIVLCLDFDDIIGWFVCLLSGRCLASDYMRVL